MWRMGLSEVLPREEVMWNELLGDRKEGSLDRLLICVFGGSHGRKLWDINWDTIYGRGRVLEYTNTRIPWTGRGSSQLCPVWLCRLFFQP
jgi:hypothetical protein